MRVSTLLPNDRTEKYRQPVQLSDLIHYFQDGSKPRSAWRVGAEFEKFALHPQTGQTISYEQPGGIREILQRLVDRFGWEPHYQGGHLTTLTRLGSAISLEPGCQVEFSSPPVEHLNDLANHLHQHRAELQAVTSDLPITWIAAGVTPFTKVEDFPKPLRNRHQMMAEYMPSRGPMSLHMMYATASTQVAFDYSDEEDALAKFTTALKLSPIINAIWANSPIYGGEQTGWASFRARIWLGMDPDRCGLLPELLVAEHRFETWTNYLLDVPMLFRLEQGELAPADGRPFRDFLNQGLDGRWPTLADWELHLTTVFPEVRLKQFLEVRGADANPPALALAVPAFWKGLLYDRQALAAAQEVVRQVTPAELVQTYTNGAKNGLNTLHHGRPLLDWAKELLTVAQVGLKLQNCADDCAYLEPVEELLHGGESAGTRLTRQPVSWSQLQREWNYIS